VVIASENRIDANIWPRYCGWGMLWWFVGEYYSSHVGVYIDPYHRSQGLGRIVLQRLRRVADIVGFNPIAQPSTAQALKLYQSTGFTVDMIHMEQQ
jgi:GNAT superfamily N-acetyltransferase